MYQDDPGAEFMMKAWSQGTDWTARILRIFLFTMAMTAFVFSVLVFQSCAFLDYSVEPGDDSSTPRDYLQFWRYHDDNNNETSSLELDTSATLGLYRYSPNNVSACIEYGIAVDDLPTGFRAARIGSILGLVCGAVAGFLMLVEFICCRFWCSRVIIVFLVLFASIFQLVTFALFTAETCHPNGVVYACRFGEGATYALVAAAFYALTSFLTCVTPKAVPIAHVIQDMERYSVVDPCCCLPGRTRQDILEEHASLRKEDTLPPQVIEGVQGYEYKQYYDSKAGVTLQDQLRAAYTQWLKCEHEYDQTLDRFQQECRDAGEVSWREVWKQRDEIQDELLARLVRMLETQRIQCERAKEDLERFRLELDIATTPLAARDIEMVDDLMIVEGFPEEEETKVDEMPSSRVRDGWWCIVKKPCQWQRRTKQSQNETDSTKHRPGESSGSKTVFHSAKEKKDDEDEIVSESGYETPDSNTRKNGEDG